MATTATQDRLFNGLIVRELTTNSGTLERVLEFINNEFDPEDVFSEKYLHEWAENNGYVKKSCTDQKND